MKRIGGGLVGRHRPGQVFWAVVALLTLSGASCSGEEHYTPRNGDIVFQSSRTEQSRAIQLATGSRYSHMGLVYLRDGEPLVLEAVQPVRLTPLAEWIARGQDEHVVVKRLRDADRHLTPAVLQRMRAVGEGFLGRHYDFYFGWSDERLYCSELVWKIYQRAARIRIGEPQALADFDLSHPLVAARLRQRYGDSPPLDERVIAPGAMFESPRLVTVYRN